MAVSQVNRKHKDTLFRIIFGEHKEYALSLYNAINKSDYKNINDLKIITLEDALYIDVKNDVGYIFHDEMTLIEHQSTYNPNMPIRGLGYFADSYIEYISETYGSADAVYSDAKLKLPTPKFYVMYNGLKEMKDVDLKLSDLYNGAGDVEVVAHMININLGHNEALLEACKPLKDYSVLIQLIRDNRKKGHSAEESVSLAVDKCIEEDVLTDILKKERDKVANFLYRGLTEEEKKRLEVRNREYAISQAVEQATEQVTKQQKLIDVDAIVSGTPMDITEACKLLGVSEKDYYAYKENIQSAE